MKFPSHSLFVALALSVVLALSFLLPLPPPSGEGGPAVWHLPLCGFRFLTGLPCPLCGLTRSFVETAHARIGEAFRYHMLGPPLWALTAAAVLYHLGAVAWWALAGRAQEEERQGAGAGKKRKRWILPAIVILFTAVWILKLCLTDPSYW